MSRFFTITDPTWKWVAISASLLGAIVLLALLHLMPRQAKRLVTAAVAFLGGGVLIVAFVLPPEPQSGKNYFSAAVDILGQFSQVVVGFSILLGIYNLCRIHFNRISRTRPDWGYSIVFFVAFFAMGIAAFWRDWPEWFAEKYVPPPWIKAQGEGGLDAYTLLFNGLLRNMDSTMFSIIAFYIVSAAYRAFRIRSLEAALLMIAAVILMLGQVPVGVLLTNWIPPDSWAAGLRIENVSGWLLGYINGPAQRAIGLGLSLGQLAMSLRIWLSLERGTFFGSEV